MLQRRFLRGVVKANLSLDKKFDSQISFSVDLGTWQYEKFQQLLKPLPVSVNLRNCVTLRTSLPGILVCVLIFMFISHNKLFIFSESKYQFYLHFGVAYYETSGCFVWLEWSC